MPGEAVLGVCFRAFSAADRAERHTLILAITPRKGERHRKKTQAGGHLNTHTHMHARSNWHMQQTHSTYLMTWTHQVRHIFHRNRRCCFASQRHGTFWQTRLPKSLWRHARTRCWNSALCSSLFFFSLSNTCTSVRDAKHMITLCAILQQCE